jgi:phosphoketolase
VIYIAGPIELVGGFLVMDRFHLIADIIERVGLGSIAAYAKQAIRDKRIEHQEYIRKSRLLANP